MPEVVTERRGHVLVVTINRPDVRNAIDAAVAHGIADAMDRLDTDGDLHVGVLTGAGGYFSSGMDLKAFHATRELPHVPGRGFGGLVQKPPSTPLIAAVEGFALAGGFELALACDLITAARGARFGIPEVKRGLVAAAGALLRLPNVLPSSVATQLALTGEPLLADDAYRYGMVNALTEPGAALEAALTIADTISANAPLGVAASKAILRDAPGWPRAAVWERQRAITDVVIASDDAREGARAFAEKREPVWLGR